MLFINKTYRYENKVFKIREMPQMYLFFKQTMKHIIFAFVVAVGSTRIYAKITSFAFWSLVSFRLLWKMSRLTRIQKISDWWGHKTSCILQIILINNYHCFNAKLSFTKIVICNWPLRKRLESLENTTGLRSVLWTKTRIEEIGNKTKNVRGVKRSINNYQTRTNALF